MIHWDNSIEVIIENIKEVCDADLNSRKRMLRVLDMLVMEELLWYHDEYIDN